MPLILSTSTISTAAGVTAISMDAAGRVGMPNRPHAICKMNSGNTGAYNNLANPNPLIPTNILRNVGSVYSSSTGYFTAPIAGLYELNFHSNVYTVSANSWIRLRSYINGVNYSDHYSDKVASSWQYLSSHDLMYMNAGDYAYLTLDTASGTVGTDVNLYTLISFALIG